MLKGILPPAESADRDPQASYEVAQEDDNASGSHVRLAVLEVAIARLAALLAHEPPECVVFVSLLRLAAFLIQLPTPQLATSLTCLGFVLVAILTLGSRANAHSLIAMQRSRDTTRLAPVGTIGFHLLARGRAHSQEAQGEDCQQ